MNKKYFYKPGRAFLILLLLFTNRLQGPQKLQAQDFLQQIEWGLQEDFKNSFLEIRTNQQKDNVNFGVNIFSSCVLKKFPCQIKAGNLTSGGAFSKLKNPSISSSISPFSQASGTASFITSGLPGFSTSSENSSYFAEAGWLNKKIIFSQAKLNCFYAQNTNPVFSYFHELKPAKSVTITQSLTGGIFDYQENTFSSWFTADDFYYHKGSQFSFLFQTGIQTRNFKGLFSLFNYTSPLGQKQLLYKTENNLNFGKTKINLWIFYNPYKKVITASDSLLKDNLQLKFEVCTTFSAGKNRPLFIKPGFSFYTSSDFSETTMPFKAAAGLNFITGTNLLSLQEQTGITLYKSQQQLSASLDSLSLQIKNTHSFQTLSAAAGLNWSLTSIQEPEQRKNTGKISLTISTIRKIQITSDSAFSIGIKKQEITDKKISQSLQLKWKCKYFNFTGKLKFNYDFL